MLVVSAHEGCATSVGFTPMAPVLPPLPVVRKPNAVVMSGALGRRAAFLGALALPTLSAHADSIEEIAARNAAAAEAAKSPEVLAAKAAE